MAYIGLFNKIGAIVLRTVGVQVSIAYILGAPKPPKKTAVHPYPADLCVPWSLLPDDQKLAPFLGKSRALRLAELAACRSVPKRVPSTPNSGGMRSHIRCLPWLWGPSTVIFGYLDRLRETPSSWNMDVGCVLLASILSLVWSWRMGMLFQLSGF